MYSKLINFRNIRTCIVEIVEKLRQIKEGETDVNLTNELVTAYLCASFLDPNLSQEMKKFHQEFKDDYAKKPQTTYYLIDDIINLQTREDWDAYKTEKRIKLEFDNMEITTA